MPFPHCFKAVQEGHSFFWVNISIAEIISAVLYLLET
jgi:hypothetical protein